MLIKLETIWLTIISVLIMVCFYVSFSEYVFKHYHYLGFLKNENILLILISSLFFTIFYAASKTNVERAMLTLIYPATIFASGSLMTHTVLFLFFGAWHIVQFCFEKKDLAPKAKLSISKWTVILVCSLLVFAYIRFGHFESGGFSDTDQLYQAREDRKNSMNSIEFLFENLVSKQILPIFGFILLAYFKVPKTLLLVLLLTFGAIIFFLTTRKSLAVVLLLPILYPIFKASAVRFSVFLCSGLLTLTLLSQVLLETPFNFIISTLLRRLFFTPAMVLEGYVNYFTDHPYTLFGHTFLKFFDLEFTYLPPLVATYSFGYYFNANTGAIGNAFAGFGLLGVVFISIVLSFVFKLIFSRSMSDIAYLPATLFFLSLVTNNDFYVLVTAHGFVVLFFLVFVRVQR